MLLGVPERGALAAREQRVNAAIAYRPAGCCGRLTSVDAQNRPYIDS